MFGIKTPRRRASGDEGEKPFWISFSDLMTALMVLFLVAMVVALMSITKPRPSPPPPQPGVDPKVAIAACVAEVTALTKLDEFKGIEVRDHSIDFKTLVRFQDGEHKFEKAGDEQFVRKFVPRVLTIARSGQCDGWLKRVVVEGFASNTGDYLFNLNLSYLRSQRILCTLLTSQTPDALSLVDRKLVQTLFLAGGSSFNTTFGTPAQMRRVELKLEFWDNPTHDRPAEIPLDPGLRCPNDR
ncbi:flagellar motor protein MotB [Variovorax rhizosphaerae]|uniref:Flagellar motor protein MotB n=1 Tax=Variovorax rhizosphaerae TaxID=1836200 RepID=A0ABU8WM25_9BURK